MENNKRKKIRNELFLNFLGFVRIYIPKKFENEINNDYSETYLEKKISKEIYENEINLKNYRLNLLLLIMSLIINLLGILTITICFSILNITYWKLISSVSVFSIFLFNEIVILGYRGSFGLWTAVKRYYFHNEYYSSKENILNNKKIKKFNKPNFVKIRNGFFNFSQEKIDIENLNSLGTKKIGNNFKGFWWLEIHKYLRILVLVTTIVLIYISIINL